MAAAETIVEPGMGTLEVFALDTSEDTLFAFLRDVFDNYWQVIHFGPLIQGAAWEIRAPAAPRKISLCDGYITVDFGEDRNVIRSQPYAPCASGFSDK